MPKIWDRRPLVLLLVAMCLVAIAIAQGVPGGQWWKRPQIAQALGLQHGQPMQIESVFRRHAMELRHLRRDLQEQDEHLKRLLGQETLDRERVLRQIEMVEQTRYRMAKQRAIMLFEVREVLTLEQWSRLQRWRGKQDAREEPDDGR